MNSNRPENSIPFFPYIRRVTNHVIYVLFDKSLVAIESVYCELFRQFSPRQLNEHPIHNCCKTISSGGPSVNRVSWLITYGTTSSIFQQDFLQYALWCHDSPRLVGPFTSCSINWKVELIQVILVGDWVTFRAFAGYRTNWTILSATDFDSVLRILCLSHGVHSQEEFGNIQLRGGGVFAAKLTP